MNTEPSDCVPQSEVQMKSLNLRTQIECMLQNAILMTEMGMDLKEKSNNGAKYVTELRTLTVQAGKTIHAMQTSSKAFLLLAQKLVALAILNIDKIKSCDPGISLKVEYEKLLNIIQKELGDSDDSDNIDYTGGSSNIPNVIDKIKYLETKQKATENACLPSSSITRSNKSEIDEKYPENLSRESLIDLDNVVNLPTVHEDIFTGFLNKPARTSSLSSLKSMRKVRLFLRRASAISDDEDESSENDELNFSKPGYGEDAQSASPPHPSLKKASLGNIKEELD